MPDVQRAAYWTVREVLFVLLAVVAAWLFFHHDLLYLDRTFEPRTIRWESFALAGAAIYGLLRTTALLAGLRVPRTAHGVETCPECGQPIEDGPHVASPAAPSRDGALAVVHRAIQSARLARVASPVLRGPVVNPPAPLAARTAPANPLPSVRPADVVSADQLPRSGAKPTASRESPASLPRTRKPGPRE